MANDDDDKINDAGQTVEVMFGVLSKNEFNQLQELVKDGDAEAINDFFEKHVKTSPEPSPQGTQYRALCEFIENIHFVMHMDDGPELAQKLLCIMVAILNDAKNIPGPIL